jgi:hypothetical protein
LPVSITGWTAGLPFRRRFLYFFSVPFIQ